MQGSCELGEYHVDSLNVNVKSVAQCLSVGRAAQRIVQAGGQQCQALQAQGGGSTLERVRQQLGLCVVVISQHGDQALHVTEVCFLKLPQQAQVFVDVAPQHGQPITHVDSR